MGLNKALLDFGGKTLLERALETLRAAGLEPQIAGGAQELSRFAPVIADAEPGLGPLGGICAALAQSSAPLAIFVPVDLPLLPPLLIRVLLARAQCTGAAVTLVSNDGFVESFPAVLDREILPTLTTAFNAGNRSCLRAFHAAAEQIGQSVCTVTLEDLRGKLPAGDASGIEPSCWFANLNTPEDFSAALEHFAGQFHNSLR
jgi:molybdopterin-guanine dinucleotide biosynthesis protein A